MPSTPIQRNEGASADTGPAGRGSGSELGLTCYSDEVEIGRGGFGVVYRARQNSLNRLVAIKVMPAATMSEQTRKRFERECQAMAKLAEHPHIVSIYDHGVTDETHRPYIVMEYVSGGSLADRGAMAWQNAVEAGVRLCGSLETAHQAGIIHRDVKPENVLLTMFDQVKLADFGVAKVQDSSDTPTGHITASILHAAPEILMGHRPDPSPTSTLSRPPSTRSSWATLPSLATTRKPSPRSSPASAWRALRICASTACPTRLHANWSAPWPKRPPTGSPRRASSACPSRCPASTGPSGHRHAGTESIRRIAGHPHRARAAHRSGFPPEPGDVAGEELRQEPPPPDAVADPGARCRRPCRRRLGHNLGTGRQRFRTPAHCNGSRSAHTGACHNEHRAGDDSGIAHIHRHAPGASQAGGKEGTDAIADTVARAVGEPFVRSDHLADQARADLHTDAHPVAVIHAHVEAPAAASAPAGQGDAHQLHRTFARCGQQLAESTRLGAASRKHTYAGRQPGGTALPGRGSAVSRWNAAVSRDRRRRHQRRQRVVRDSSDRRCVRVALPLSGKPIGAGSGPTEPAPMCWSRFSHGHRPIFAKAAFPVFVKCSFLMGQSASPTFRGHGCN